MMKHNLNNLNPRMSSCGKKVEPARSTTQVLQIERRNQILRQTFGHISSFTYLDFLILINNGALQVFIDISNL